MTSRYLCAGLLVLLITGLPTQAKEPATVAIQPLSAIGIMPELTAPATVVSLNDVLISAELTARVSELPVRVGDQVATDALLARLDCQDYQLMLERITAGLAATRARLRFNRQQLERARTLSARNTLAEETLNEREYQLAATQAELSVQQIQQTEARRAIEKCVIHSPYPAVVTERIAASGQYATPGTPLLRLLDLRTRELSAQVYVRDSESIASADTLAFRYQGENYPLKLRKLLPAVNPQTRNREVRLDFRDPEHQPPVGANGTLVWRSGRLHLPAGLLVKRDGQIGVFIAAGDKARFHPLPQAESGRPAATELAADTRIISAGFFALRDGDVLNLTAP